MTPQRLRDGALRIERYEDWLLRDAAGAPTSGDRPHGGWTVVGPFRGLGDGLVGFFELLGAATDDGVMFGECQIDQIRPLEYDRDYTVTCEVLGSTRRHGRRVPVFDVVEYVVELHDADGVAVRSTNSFIVPRHQEEQ
jgi:hypothetical protein